ncbi:MAG: SOS response-associated peptidase [Candidatus Korobacteraceae bacterium]|jgi:putative SOS response-associated peptidase YedK
MCGRYRLTRSERYIRDHFHVDEIDEDWSPRYNIAPSQQVAAIRQDPAAPVRRLSKMRWGLIPSWSKDSAIGYKTINARAETVATSPAFRGPFRSRRCLIPADGFYEWAKNGKTKQPYCFTMADDSVFAFAGLWDCWMTPDGRSVESCSIVTTKPNAIVADVHNRMPVILRPEAYDLWLDPAFSNLFELSPLLLPYDAKRMRRYAVSTRVNSPRNDDAACADPVEVSTRV